MRLEEGKGSCSRRRKDFTVLWKKICPRFKSLGTEHFPRAKRPGLCLRPCESPQKGLGDQAQGGEGKFPKLSISSADRPDMEMVVWVVLFRLRSKSEAQIFLRTRGVVSRTSVVGEEMA